MREARRYLGLELSGAKNQKTALAALEYYPKERKIFLLDIYEKIAGLSHDSEGETSDEALLDLISELQPGIARLGVNVPLQLPPCLTHSKSTCIAPGKCRSKEVKWMRAVTQKADKNPDNSIRVREFTPYTQRPVELWMRYHVLPRLPASHRFEIDETLGGNKAPLTARMQFLQRFLSDVPLAEVWPKVSIAVLALDLALSRRTVQSYRSLEEGIHAREEILEVLTERHGIFIYERDIRKLSHSLSSFDAFICAYTALLSDIQQCTKIPAGFPAASGWVQYPLLGRG